MSTEYNKDTYIGYLKMKRGGMKIIPGDKDEKIINKRNKILNHLEKVLSGGKKLKEKYIGSYFKALGGKYVRNDMCTGADNKNCNNGKLISLGGAHKLLKLAARKNFPMDEILTKFKGSAPSLYESLENKISGIKGGNREERERELAAVRAIRSRGRSDDCSGDNVDHNGWVGMTMDDVAVGIDCPDVAYWLNLKTKQRLTERAPNNYEISHPEQGVVGRQNGGALNDFRNEIGRSTFDIELNKLRDEINLIRNS